MVRCDASPLRLRRLPPNAAARRSCGNVVLLVADLGAYGLRVRGLDGAARWMQPQAADAPELTLEVAIAEPDRSPSRIDMRSCDLALRDGGRLRARNGAGAVEFSIPRQPSAAELLHPYLAPAAALVWQWVGREALHAGAVGLADGAVLLLGGEGAGKSTLLAWFALMAGHAVIADDLSIIDRGAVLAGPRSLDLEARGRVDLPSTASSVPLAGTVLLQWGSRLELATVPGSGRMQLLGAQRTYPQLAGDPRALLELAAQPMLTLTRPRDLDLLEPAARSLVDRFS